MSASLPRATQVQPHGAWNAAAADSVVLDFAQRHSQHSTLTGLRGLAFLLDLPQAVALRSGDALCLEDGRLVEVVAAPEALAEIRCPDALELARIAWFFGNRHLPVQILPRSLRIRRDPALEDMARGRGAKVMPVDAPFDPEGGAYIQHVQEHVHGPGCNHGHAHGHHHAHE